MSTIKARWRTYNKLQSLAAKVSENLDQFNAEEFRTELVSIADEWKLDERRLATISGIPPSVVVAIMGFQSNRYRPESQRLPIKASFAADTRKLINGLIAWIGPNETDLAQLQVPKTDMVNTLIALGRHARYFLDLSSSSITQLEAELCNLTKTNQIEVLAEIAFAVARLRDIVPIEGLPIESENAILRREVAVLEAKLEILSSERDRLAALVDKSTDQPSPIKSAFLQSVGNLPLMAASGAVGMLCGPDQAQVMISYVQQLVSISQGS